MNVRRSTSFGPPSVHAPGPPTFRLHTMGWRAFQDLCGAVLSQVFDQTFQTFADSNDGGRDGAFYGIWRQRTESQAVPVGPFVLQSKFFSSDASTLTLSSISDELNKIDEMVREGICSTYILLSNGRLTGRSEKAILKAVRQRGVDHVFAFGSTWINRIIAESFKLRMYVPRVYGLGDLSQILDERAYGQTQTLLQYLDSDLATLLSRIATDARQRQSRTQGLCSCWVSLPLASRSLLRCYRLRQPIYGVVEH